MAEHNKVGKWGEQYASDILDREGYEVVETNWSPPGSHRDLDVVAYSPDHTTLVIVEVKTRSHQEATMPEEAVDVKKIRNLGFCANQYIKMYNIDADVRFDIISIIGSANDVEHYEHIVDAFNPNLV